MIIKNPIDLFINLRNGNGNPRKLLKNQIEIKSDLGKIKNQNQNQRPIENVISVTQNVIQSVIQNVQFFFDFKGKILERLIIL